MAHIQVSTDNKTEVAQDYARFWAEITPYIVKAVEESFLSGAAPVRRLTQSEGKRRTEMAIELVKEMRYGMPAPWSKFRIRDTIGQALRLELVGLKVNLESLNRRSSW